MKGLENSEKKPKIIGNELNTDAIVTIVHFCHSPYPKMSFADNSAPALKDIVPIINKYRAAAYHMSHQLLQILQRFDKVVTSEIHWSTKKI